MAASACPWHWRISLDEAGLAKGSFYVYDIPVPDIAPYNDNSIEASQGEGGQAVHGFGNDDMLWEVMTPSQAFKIRQFIDAAKVGTGLLYLTIPKNDDSVPGTTWIDVHCRPHRDRQAADAGPIVGRVPGSVEHIENYHILLNNVQIINEPSLYTDN